MLSRPRRLKSLKEKRRRRLTRDGSCLRDSCCANSTNNQRDDTCAIKTIPLARLQKPCLSPTHSILSVFDRSPPLRHQFCSIVNETVPSTSKHIRAWRVLPTVWPQDVNLNFLPICLVLCLLSLFLLLLFVILLCYLLDFSFSFYRYWRSIRALSELSAWNWFDWTKLN